MALTGGKGGDVVVVGGGQAGLAAGYHLRRTGLSYVILDAQERPGGAWLHGWDSLRLFSPAQWSSLPGWLFPGQPSRYPTRDEVVSYFEQYEARYALPVERPVAVSAVRRLGDELVVETDRGEYQARAVVSATGTWQKPFVPDYPGGELFRGRQLHSARYRSPDEFRGLRVLVVGGANSGAQIHAELSLVADSTWVTLEEPRFLPDDVDGRVLFDCASERYRALKEGAGGPRRRADCSATSSWSSPSSRPASAGCSRACGRSSGSPRPAWSGPTAPRLGSTPSSGVPASNRRSTTCAPWES